MDPEPLSRFLAADPFSLPRSERLCRAEMRAIHREARDCLGADTTTLDRRFAHLGHGPVREHSVYACDDACRPAGTGLMQPWGPVRHGDDRPALARRCGTTPLRRARVVSRATGLCRDGAFSRLGRRRRGLPHGRAALLALTSYKLRPPHSRGTETACACPRG